MIIEHLAINVPDAAQTANWYAENLGMTVIRDLGDANQTHFLADSAGRTILEVYSNPAAAFPDYEQMSPLTLHIAFAVENIEAERVRLLEAGARAEGPIDHTPAGDRLAFLRDPWGVSLQLVSRAKPMVGEREL